MSLVTRFTSPWSSSEWTWNDPPRLHCFNCQPLSYLIFPHSDFHAKSLIIKYFEHTISRGLIRGRLYVSLDIYDLIFQRWTIHLCSHMIVDHPSLLFPLLCCFPRGKKSLVFALSLISLESRSFSTTRMSERTWEDARGSGITERVIESDDHLFNCSH